MVQIPVRLNVGSGQRRFDTAHGWVNVDCVSRPPDQVPDLICDVGKEPLPYEDGTVDMVVLHHVLEHFGCGEADALMRECYRVLKDSGSLIVCVPDMRVLALRFLSNRLSTQVYMTNVYGAYQGEEGDRHKWGYDIASLSEYLRKFQWSYVRQFNDRPIPGADIAQDYWIISLECIK